MKNIFAKAKVESLLNNKISSGEIKFYRMGQESLHIKISKRCKYTLDISNLSDEIVVRLLVKKFPNPSVINLSDFFKRELRNLKIQEIIK
jgi:hypothetical protein